MFHYRIQKRMYYVFLAVMLILFVMVIRVFYIQVFKYNKLSSLANGLWNRNLPILADRGLITDRNGEILADNITTTSLVVIPNQIKNKEEVAKNIASILNVDYLNIYKHLNKITSIERIHPEGRRLSYEVAEKINNLDYDGVYLLKESKRYYPYKTVLSHVLGYVGIDNQGLSGIELQYDKYVTGEAGAIKYFSDATTRQNFINELKSRRKLDIIKGFTTKGIHRDDFVIYINKKEVGIFGSQGQNRTAMLSLKLSELQVIYDDIGEYPILLLDDFMSELDCKRRENFLNHIKNIQVIITCTEKITLEKLNYFSYNVINGEVIEKE